MTEESKKEPPSKQSIKQSANKRHQTYKLSKIRTEFSIGWAETEIVTKMIKKNPKSAMPGICYHSALSA